MITCTDTSDCVVLVFVCVCVSVCVSVCTWGDGGGGGVVVNIKPWPIKMCLFLRSKIQKLKDELVLLGIAD